MARYQKQRIDYPMGTVSQGTMLNEDLIPDFIWELKRLARQPGIRPAKARKAHLALALDIEERMEGGEDYESESANCLRASSTASKSLI